MTSMAWHYTTGLHFMRIVESGILDPRRSVAVYERPILWFSVQPYWEPTACKSAVRQGELVTLSMRETFDAGRGLTRFGVPKRRLVAWPKIGRQAGLRDADVAALERTGIQQGSDPTDWLGTLKPIRLRECRQIEVMRADFSGWEPVPVPA
jgi:hypothetical protein